MCTRVRLGSPRSAPWPARLTQLSPAVCVPPRCPEHDDEEAEAASSEAGDDDHLGDRDALYDIANPEDLGNEVQEEAAEAQGQP